MLKYLYSFKYFVLISIIFCYLFKLSDAKVYTRCGFKDELVFNKFDKTFIPQWACMVDSESGRDTTKVGVGPSGSQKFGIFQINSKDYCQKGKAGGHCNIKCEDLLNDDITDDSKCAKLVQQREGFLAWDGWRLSCKNRNLDGYLSFCPETPPMRRKFDKRG
ncbi:lysozyme-like [Chrysoperla carnea]|uniref:lysozyme-like n=1 Tax=Chrysoperla carnea TaxID=189513 RepID=UPI001D072007|nr:lysozyme-like [Chrysoperla carnea]